MRLRWDELSPEERREFAKVSVDLMNEIANSSEEWALKSQTAALVAEVYFCLHADITKHHVQPLYTHLLIFFNLLQIVRREGVSLWQELVPSLISLSSSGPAHVMKNPFPVFLMILTELLFNLAYGKSS